MKICTLSIYTILLLSLPAQGGWVAQFGLTTAAGILVTSCLKVKPKLCKPEKLKQLSYMTIHNEEVRGVVSTVFYNLTRSKHYRNKIANDTKLQARYEQIKATLEL
jgi:hypothetical protein